MNLYFCIWFRLFKTRKDHWQVSDKLLHGQLVKRKERKMFAMMRMRWGKRADLHARLQEHEFRKLIQTIFVERVNLTIRRGVAPLMRKTWVLAQTSTHLVLHIEWWRAYYHFVRPHESLMVRVAEQKAHNCASRRWRPA